MVQRQGALRLFTRALGNGQAICDVDFREEEHFVLPLLEVPFDLGLQRAAIGGNLTRLRRAGEGAGYSRADGGHHMVECGRQLFLSLILIPGLDAAVDAGADRLWERFDKSLFDAALLGADADLVKHSPVTILCR
jgi:hypothetical protein